jgi:hypothetical protein
MIEADQIREKLRQLLMESISLDAFDEWIARETWNMHLDSAPEAINLAGKVELLLAEFDGGYLSNQKLFERLGSLIAFQPDLYSANSQPAAHAGKSA